MLRCWHPSWSPTTSADIALSRFFQQNARNKKSQWLKCFVIKSQYKIYTSPTTIKTWLCLLHMVYHVLSCFIRFPQCDTSSSQTWHVWNPVGRIILSSSIGRYSWARDLWPSHSANVLTAACSFDTTFELQVLFESCLEVSLFSVCICLPPQECFILRKNPPDTYISLMGGSVNCNHLSHKAGVQWEGGDKCTSKDFELSVFLFSLLWTLGHFSHVR